MIQQDVFEHIHEETFMFLGVLLLVGWVIYLVFRRYQVISEARMKRAETFNKLVEKFSSAQEFSDFLQTENGRKFIEDPLPSPSHPYGKVLRYLQAGILSLLIGFAYWINAGRIDPHDPTYITQIRDSNYWGTLAVFLGIGLLVVGGVTYFLTRHWHLGNGSSKK